MSGVPRIRIEAIIDAALSLVRERGWDGVSARSLAKALNTSTMPIYSTIGSMEALRGKARARTLAMMEEYQGRAWTEEALLNKALGYIHFARREGRLFRFLFESRGDSPVSVETMKSMNAAQAEGSADFTAAFGTMPREGVASVGFHSWIYVHGLACLLADGLLTLGDDELLRCLQTAGGAFYAHISSNGG